MAATNYTPISLYYSTTASAVPTAGNLISGELAINITDGKLYYKNNSGVVTLIAGATAGPAGGSNNQVQYNSSGLLTGSANLTFNGTTLTANTIGAFILSGNVTNTGNPSLNIGSGALTAGATGVTTLTATGISTFNSDASTRESIAIKGRSSDNSGRINLQSNAGTTDSALYWSSTDGVVGLLDSTLAKGLTIATATGAATFSGALTASDTILLQKSGTGSSLIEAYNSTSGTESISLANGSAGAVYGIPASETGAGSRSNHPFNIVFNSTQMMRFTSGNISAGSNAFQMGALTATKTTAGDVATFTNGGSTPKPLVAYSDDTISGIFGGGAGSGGGIFFTGNTGATIRVGGSDIAVASSTGLAVTGTLSATKTTAGDVATFTNAAASNKTLYVYTDATYAGIASSASLSTAGFALYYDTPALEVVTNTPTSGKILGKVNNVTVSTLTSTGVSITGTLTTASDITNTSASANAVLTLNSTGGSGRNFALLSQNSSGSLLFYDATAAAVRGGFDNTGLFAANNGASVTGALSATGSLTVGPTVASPVGAYSTIYSDNPTDQNALEIRQGRFNKTNLILSTNQTTSGYFLRVNENGTDVLTIGSGGALSATGSITTSDGTVTGLFGNNAFTAGVVGIGSTTNHPLVFGTNSSERMRLDTSGNLGLGVAPEAWGTQGKAIQIGTLGAISEQYFSSTNDQITVSSNAYRQTDTAWYYINSTNKATALTQIEGEYRFFTAAAGTADTAITFTQAMTLDASGNLLVGTTTAFTTGFTAGADGRIATTITNAALPNIQYWSQATSGDNKFAEFYTEGGGGSLRGSITYNRAGGLVSYNTTSDYRAKDLFGEFTGSGAIIDSLKVYDGLMKGASIRRPMFVAHEAQAVVPYAVTGAKDAVNDKGDPVYQSMDHQILVPLLVAEVQSLRSRISLLEATTR